MARILIAEDSSHVLKSLREAFQTAGHEVEAVADGRAAVESYRNTRHDLVITDVFMPILDGIGAIMQIRKISSRVPIIAISEISKAVEQDFLDTAKILGAARTFRKPIDPEALLSEAVELLQTSKQDRQA
jgi:CheY-like chemotaxis protein